MTPIRELIEFAEKELNNGVGKSYPIMLNNIISKAAILLQKEKQFAYNLFEAGDNYSGELEHGNPMDAINFETYYKKIENERN